MEVFQITPEEPLAPLDWIDDDCKKYWNDALQFLGTSFEEHLRYFLTELGSVLGVTTDFKVRIVVDTNAVITEIMRLMKHKDPFLSKLTNSPFLDAIAPVMLRVELQEKIVEIYPDSKERAKASKIAESIIEKIRIVEGFQINPKVRAIAQMDERDPEDVVFVQIAIEYETHGVLTEDRAFENLEGVKDWKLGEVGRIITEVNRGALTLWVTGVGFPVAALTLIKLGMMLVSLGFAAVKQFAAAGIELGKRAIGSIVESVKANPLLSLVVAGGATLLAIFLYSWEPSRKVIDDIVSEGKKAINSMINGTAEIIQALHNSTQALVDVAKEQLPSLAQWLDCLTSSSLLLVRRVNELEDIRAS